MRKYRKPARIFPYVSVRVLPAAALVLFAIWAVKDHVAHRAIVGELEKQLFREGTLLAAAATSRLQTLVETTKSLATDELILSFLIDTEGRGANLPSVFNALRMPGTDHARIVLTDDRARPVAATGGMVSDAGNPWAEKALAGETVVDLSASGLRIAVPVLFPAAKGAIVVEYSPGDLPALFSIPAQAEAIAVVDARGAILFSANRAFLPTDQVYVPGKIEGWVHVAVALDGFPGISVIVAEMTRSAYAGAEHIHEAELTMLVLYILAIAAGIGLVAYVVTTPLRHLSRQISAVGSALDLKRRVAPAGPAEIHELGQSFNAMLGALQATTTSQEHLDSIINSLSEALLVTSDQGVIRMINPAARELLGPSDDPVGRNIRDIGLFEANKVPANLLTDGDDGAPARIEVVHHVKDRTPLIYHWSKSAMTGCDGAPRGQILVGRDITERKRAQELLQAIITASPTAIIALSQENLVTLWNPSAEKIFGWTPDEVLGRPLPTVAPGDTDFAKLNETIWSQGRSHSNLEVKRLTRQGTVIDASLSVAPLKNSSGEVIGVVGMMFDITEKKNAERELRHSKAQLEIKTEELERSNKELDEFAYIASHDLKEPLRGIHNYAAFLLEDYADKLDEEGRDMLASLKRLSKRMDSLIDDILQFSRAGRVDLGMEETDLNDVLDGVIESLQIWLDEKNVEIRVPRPLPAVSCDRARVGELLRNLVTNAAKYNDKPERWVEVGYTAAGQPPPALVNGGCEAPAGVEGQIIFYVRDNGIGIPEKHHETIFRMFKRLHGRDQFDGGTGAGMSIVKKIVERHGGEIWLDSAFGKGTAFYFTLGEASLP